MDEKSGPETLYQRKGSSSLSVIWRDNQPVSVELFLLLCCVRKPNDADADVHTSHLVILINN